MNPARNLLLERSLLLMLRVRDPESQRIKKTFCQLHNRV